MTSGYSYRADRGDYYYGQPQTEYRYYGGYDEGYGWPGSYGPYRGRHYGYGYGYPGWYGGYGYGPRWGYPYQTYRPRYRHPRPPVGTVPPPGPSVPNDGDGEGRAPWRDFDELRRRRGNDDIGRRVEPSAPQAQPRMAPREMRAGREDSNIGRMIRESRQAPRGGEAPVQEETP